MSAKTVCLIGPGHIASNPRLVKESDALHAAGFRVRVVSGTSHPLVTPLDVALQASRPWAVHRVTLGSRWRRVPRVVGQRISFALVCRRWLKTPTAIAWAESELTGRLTRAACAEPADLYIGHYLPGLYAASRAASRHGTKFGFDAEDSHVDELSDVPEHRGRRAARESLERELLARCAHFTAASPLIADAYERRYGRRPMTVLNVFPRSESPPKPVPTTYLKGEGQPTLYWFSQTVGPGRGLEALVVATGRMRVPVVLHLRGIPGTGYRERLEAHAATHRVRERIVWHPPAAPGEMVRLSAGYDAGLALELTKPPNRAICLTNKAFTYLLAGIPVLLSDTPAQRLLAGELGDAGSLVDLTDPEKLAAALDGFLADRAGLVRRREVAWRLGRDRYNWELERRAFLTSVEAALHGG